jgi:hypothetical protein
MIKVKTNTMSHFSKKDVTILFAAATLMLTVSCKNKTGYQETQKQVLNLHEQVMADGGKAEGYEMQFNALLKSGLKQLKANQPSLDTVAARAQILQLNKKLSSADDQMENWMHAYDNDFKGKTDQQTLNYFTTAKLNVVRIDSLYKDALKPAGDYLKKLNIKPDTAKAKMKM